MTKPIPVAKVYSCIGTCPDCKVGTGSRHSVGCQYRLPPTGLSQQQKIEKMENLFAQIQELFPNGDCSITIHNIHIFALDDSWTKESNFIESDKRMYMTARKQANPFGITLFD